MNQPMTAQRLSNIKRIAYSMTLGAANFLQLTMKRREWNTIQPSTVLDLIEHCEILGAEKTNLKQVINNLETDVLGDLLRERDRALALLELVRPKMTEEQQACAFMEHVLPSVYDGYDPSGYAVHDVMYKSSKGNSYIAATWTEAAEKWAQGWRPLK